MKLADLAETIRETRKSKSIGQAALAQRAKISRATLDAFENGRKADIGLKTLERIANVLELEVRLMPFGIRRPTLSDLLDEAEKDEQ